MSERTCYSTIFFLIGASISFLHLFQRKSAGLYITALWQPPATNIDIVMTLHELLAEPAFQSKTGKDRIIVLDDCTKHLEVANLYQRTISLLKNYHSVNFIVVNFMAIKFTTNITKRITPNKFFHENMESTIRTVNFL